MRPPVNDPSMRFYRENAKTYVEQTRQMPPSLRAFMARLPAGAAVLELGCGSGADSAEMLAQGFRVTPSDGTPEMARAAQARLGIPVLLLRFADLDAVAAYDGIWANACLLHVPRPELGEILGRVRRALRRDGLFYASYKTGGAEGCDAHGRYFNRPDRDWLAGAYEAAGWRDIEIRESEGGGYGGERSLWLQVFASG